MTETERSPEGRAAQRDYVRAWRKQHPDRVRAYNMAYWEKKAKQAADRKSGPERLEIIPAEFEGAEFEGIEIEPAET